MMGSNLSQQINIGQDTESKLMAVGIRTFEELQAVGAEQAFIRLQTLDPGACLCLLSGLEGAIQGIKWHQLSAQRKEELKAFYKMAKKSIK
jgi:DNA transformation protein and related proteins